TVAGAKKITVKGTASSNFIINNNILEGGDVAVSFEPGSYSGTLHMHTNSITLNTVAALQDKMQNENRQFSAASNWWGSSNGPTTPLNTWSGTPKGGAIISNGPVIFAP